MMMRRGVRASLAAWIILAATAAGPAPAQEFARYGVACQERFAAEVGRDAMRSGGNAVDAAVATAFALAVTHPAAGNLGGGGFLLYSDADGEAPECVEFRERAPGSATEAMYLDAEGKLVPRHRAGPRAAGVPGTVRGLGLAHARHGALPWADVVRPAAKLAREGFPVSETLARSLNAQLFREAPGSGVAEDLGPQADRLADFAASVAAFRKPDGTPWRAGEVLRQPDLADTLDRIAAGGADEFYTGETARRVVAWMEAGGGAITAADLAAYEAKVRPVTRVTYKGHEVIGVGPPSSGGVVVGLALNILERYDLKADGRDHARTLHRVTEAMRRAYLIRATRLGDPDSNRIDVERLLSKEYAATLARTIDEQKATPSAALADFPIAGLPEPSHTTHLSVIDAAGNAVALTYTLEEGYGSKSVVPGAGFLLNNEMGDFNLIPGRTDARGRIGTRPNLISPGKRMLSSQSPTIVRKGGRLLLVTGSPGGRTIPNTVLWVLLGVLEFGLEPRAALDAPRTHHAWFPDVLLLEGDAWPEGVRAGLEGMGHVLGRAAIQGDAHSMAVDPATGRRIGLPDRRRVTGFASGD
jgi:gamma-glutamyltranspeptidase/glutathione hydrolase